MSIDAMKQALEALGYGYDAARCTAAVETIRNAESALRAAIAEAEKVEPIAGLSPEQVASLYANGIPLYTTPQPAIPAWQPTNEELTTIYMKANGIEGKNPPITTERIFTAMRAMIAAAPKPENGK